MVPVGIGWAGSRMRAIMASSGISKGARMPNREAGVKPKCGVVLGVPEHEHQALAPRPSPRARAASSPARMAAEPAPLR